MKTFKHLDLITTAFAVVLILSNITSTKILSLGWFSFDGGTILFPLVYIFGDILTEVYGYARARRVIWIGFAMNLLMVITFWVVQKLPPALDWGNQAAFESILGVVPRIVLGSLCAYLIGEFLNSYILAKIKIKTHGKFLWLRTIGSTVVGQFFDTTVFLLIAFAGVLPWNLIWIIWVSNYIFKILVEIILLPVTYRVAGWLKKREEVDYYDTNTNFNPLKIKN
ncbi:MAG: transporter [Candidatus Magasanikbacteria bacterium RIFCSPLOWO2_01_FULL_43_20b]|uniref:Probable queuosine precursor transporter n=1 Tax=Candidatus Magasanikbacteria bacterium RIFCSPLOWO2_12_FULL_43_12 TaxID=1798692 RepID=A0A1F6MU69_9BACT|nr:MAG: transporter [Candidatus Magasanikbacteria bacterium RIFCSPHIGHO2_02_FULL_44_13]OGH72721.1 MAG: transporter [Candidatus Magasanikbacteria bacterium RIFCSPLOWO2_02_FULL_43_22]OGH72934.1 MAG: transporter [Candidatus Magasanikbacteria bacterium RIFCSPLOWO2_01_FULL_43_20b]OGH74983.1 MAG: transporter [Candidatus Magasanikbacteria bacterium RIFCSPLOWO2_12_FULL_43_12]